MVVKVFRPCHYCGGNVTDHINASCIPNAEENWCAWSKAIATGIQAVGDDVLRRAAETITACTRVVVTAGNGGSASLASHAAQAIMKPDYKAGGGRAAVCLTDAVPTITAHANDGRWATALTDTALPFFKPGAVLLVFSSSGKSENVVKLADTAVFMGVKVIAFTGFDGGPLRSLADVSVHVDSSDYEVVEPVHDALMHRVQYHLRELNKK